jgi:hypothetical protein
VSWQPRRYIKVTILWIVLTIPSIVSINSSYGSMFEQVTYDEKEKRDPMILPNEDRVIWGEVDGLMNVQHVDQITLSGIVVEAGSHPVAVANNVIVMVGDRFGGVEVLKIQSDGVLFQIKDQTAFKQFREENDDPEAVLFADPPSGSGRD